MALHHELARKVPLVAVLVTTDEHDLDAEPGDLDNLGSLMPEHEHVADHPIDPVPITRELLSPQG